MWLPQKLEAKTLNSNAASATSAAEWASAHEWPVSQLSKDLT